MSERQSSDNKGRSGRWVMLAEEPDQISAEILVNYLRQVAIPVRLDAGSTMSFLGPSPHPTRVLVPEEWLDDAIGALERRGLDEELPPGVRL
ncbi:MAG: hypothetical protein O6913_11075 [Chloroflexi bacterium]|nr:hypothetical protein [Chloroflexota bacterium]